MRRRKTEAVMRGKRGKYLSMDSKQEKELQEGKKSMKDRQKMKTRNIKRNSHKGLIS